MVAQADAYHGATGRANANFSLVASLDTNIRFLYTVSHETVTQGVAIAMAIRQFPSCVALCHDAKNS